MNYRSWNTVTPLSRILALILFIALPFLGFWLGLSQRPAVSNQIPLRPAQPTSKCDNEGCVFKNEFGNGGYGSLKGYYFANTTTDPRFPGKIYNCDWITVTQSSVALDGIYGGYIGGLSLTLNLSNLSPSDKSVILSSTKEKPVELFVFWPTSLGHGYQGCVPSSFEIIRVS